MLGRARPGSFGRRQIFNARDVTLVIRRNQHISNRLSSIRERDTSTTNVHDRPLLRISFGLAQNFVRNRRRVALSKRDVLQQI
jgi:hypothetical protein